MRFVIVTGMSGAGKSSALNMLEDMGYFCVDNIPIKLIHKLAMINTNDGDSYEKLALGVDIRGGEDFSQMPMVLEQLDSLGIKYEILFMECADDVLIKRYSQTRRNHPLARNGRIETGIEKEREALSFIRSKADYIIDTSRMLIRQLKQSVDDIFEDNKDFKNFVVTVLSFGYKYGIPEDADLVFDVRFLPNPYYEDDLKRLTGEDKEVQDYVLSDGTADVFMDKTMDMLNFLIPCYIKEGKTRLLIAFGCTGGRHRSVTVANRIYEKLPKTGFSKFKEHRDIYHT